MQPLLLTLDEVAEALRQSRQSVYRHIANGDLEAVKVGKSRRVPRESLEAFVDRLRAEAAGSVALSELDLTAAAVELVERTRAEQGLPPHVEDAATLRQVARILSTREATPDTTRGHSSSSRSTSTADTGTKPDG